MKEEGPRRNRGQVAVKGALIRHFSGTAEMAAKKVVYCVIPSEARNLSSIWLHEKKERFLASLGMT